MEVTVKLMTQSPVDDRILWFLKMGIAASQKSMSPDVERWLCWSSGQG